MFAQLTSALVALLAPSRCACCRRWEAGASGFCQPCEVFLPPCPPGRQLGAIPLQSAFYYEGSLRQALLEFKFGRRPQLASVLSGHLVPALARLPAGAEYLVATPSTPARIARRGYNPAGLLARELGRRCHLKVLPELLRRTVEGAHQAQLDRRQRLEALGGVFKAAPAPGASVIVVDDVLTTGATALACSRALIASGAAVTGVLTLAQNDKAQYRDTQTGSDAPFEPSSDSTLALDSSQVRSR